MSLSSSGLGEKSKKENLLSQWKSAHCFPSMTYSQIGKIIYTLYPDNIAFKSENKKL